ncbi:MAG: GcrA family cell cycle regulator [Mesorhizobium sp.]
MSAWYPSEMAKLRELTAKGLSAGVIAAQLNRQFGNGRSRNAVIGKLMRGNGKFGRLTPRSTYAATTNVEIKTAVRPTPKPQSAASSLGRADQTGAAIPRAAPVTLPATPPDAVILTVSPDCKSYSVPATRPVRFLDALFADRCLHFVGDIYSPGGPDMPVCGAERAQGVLGTRYCCRHLASQHQARVPA